MAGGITRDEANVLLDCTMNGVAYPRASGSFVSLLTAAGSATAPGTEVTGGSYSRKGPIPFSINNGVASNSQAVNFTGLPAGTMVQTANWDASSNGNRRWWADLGTARTVAAGDTISFAVGAIQYSLGT